MNKTIKIPQLTLVALIGPSGSGKSTFAAKYFLPTEVISSDYCRGLVSDDENNQACSKDAFEVLYYIAAKRLAAGKMVVVDATNVRAEDQQKLVELAREYHVQPSAIVFDLPERVCQERNALRPDRMHFHAHVVRNHLSAMRRSVRGLARLGFRHIAHIDSQEQADQVQIVREKLWVDKRDEVGPFDIIGDIHGCYDELQTLLEQLGYQIEGGELTPSVVAPQGRKAIFLGDLVDRGPNSPAVLRLVMHMVKNGTALCVAGNHDVKLERKLFGKQVQLTHGLAQTMAQLEPLDEVWREEAREFLNSLISHFVLDGGELVVAHAGLKEELQGRASGVVRSFALYGETTGETDEYGLPVRNNWAADYRGKAMVVYGHTPTTQAEWVNRTICIDTGCVFGGQLTALRYPERELVSVNAQQMYCEPVRPLTPAGESVDTARSYSVLDVKDVLYKNHIRPRIGHAVTINEGHASAAMEVMSRFAIDPRWLVYLPPTMSPCATAPEGAYLEYPTQAFDYYRNAGVDELVCEEKHMGSRAVAVLCRDEGVATQRFGIKGHGRGVIYTRTGRSFFNQKSTTEQVLARLDAALEKSGLWAALKTNWIVLDLELLPWSAKAGDLLIQQYAPTGASGRAYVHAAQSWLQQAMDRGIDVGKTKQDMAQREQDLARYIDEYRNYCWPVESIADLRLAPFQILAYEGQAAIAKEHRWQLDMLDQLCAVDEQFFKRTDRRYVNLNDPQSEAIAAQWWEELTTQERQEGMVIKPVQVVVSGHKGLLQPAVKCRGRDYLRIIYGPSYTEEVNLNRLRKRGLGLKRSLALREFSLGYEALHRFVENEPLYRVHECVFGVLALESEPVDPRL